jgi:hypothetical protein
MTRDFNKFSSARPRVTVYYTAIAANNIYLKKNKKTYNLPKCKQAM